MNYSTSRVKYTTTSSLSVRLPDLDQLDNFPNPAMSTDGSSEVCELYADKVV